MNDAGIGGSSGGSSESYQKGGEEEARQEHLLAQIALGKYNSMTLPWKPDVANVIVKRLAERVMALNKMYPYVEEFSKDTLEGSVARLSEAILSFDRPPFTLQRLCEILLEPKSEAMQCPRKSTNAYVRRLAKMVSVTSSLK